MKRKKLNSQQLAIDFDNIDRIENNFFQINNQESFNFSIDSNCKIISFNAYNQSKDNELLEKFYALSNHLD